MQIRKNSNQILDKIVYDINGPPKHEIGTITQAKPDDSDNGKRKYTHFIRETKKKGVSDNEQSVKHGLDINQLRRQDYLSLLPPADRKNLEVTQNLDMLMNHRRNIIRNQFKPLDLYFSEQRSKFSCEDIDLIDKAERYMEEAITHKKAKEMERYEIPEKI